MFIENKNVQFIGLNQLHEDDQEKIKDIIYNKYIFIEREIKRINSLRFHFKVYEKGGRKKYSVHLLVDSPTGVITVDRMYGPTQWDPIAAVYEVIDKAREQIRRKFRTDSSYHKPHEGGVL